MGCEQWPLGAHTKSLLLLLSRCSRVRLCATPRTADHQAPLSLGFSRQEHWSGLPLPSPMHEGEKWSEVAQLCPTLRNLMDCSPPGSSIHGIFQARVLEWDAIAFSWNHWGKTKSDQTNFPPYSDPRQEKRNATNKMPTDSKNHPTSSLLSSLWIWWSPTSWTAVELVRSVFQSVRECWLWSNVN